MRTFKINLYGQDYEAAALPFGAVRKLTREGAFEKIDKANSGEKEDLIAAFEVVIEIISAGLKPLNPECDADWVAERVPFGPEGMALLREVLKLSGFEAMSSGGNGGGNAGSP
jgi:hypothetical protein